MTLAFATLATPLGTVVSYGEVARRVGRAGAARAVGGAMAANPVPILIPCHRVVRADGTPGGYSGGPPGGGADPRSGAATKLWLLDFERDVGGPGAAKP